MQVMPGAAGALASGRGIGQSQTSPAPPNWQRLQQLKNKYDPEDVSFSYLSAG